MGLERSEPDANRPYFFLSYAHTPRLDPFDAPDPDMWVHRLFRDLCEYIMSMTDVPAVGFMDREMRAGESWSDRTAEALATCRVFVPLYSPRYFISDTCGREWSAFSQRQARHSALSPPGPPAIVPALWAPVPFQRLPHAAQSLPYEHERFGREYTTFGLYGLMKLRSFRQQYEKITYLLAQTITATAQQNPLPVGRPLDFAQLPSAFEQRTSLRRMRIIVAAPSRQELPPGRPVQCYGPSALDWNPYRQSDTDSTRPLAEIAAAIAERLDYRPTIESLDGAVGGLLTERRPDGLALILLDKWTLSDPKWRALLTRVDDAALPWLGVIVPSDASGSDDESGLGWQTALEQTLPRTVQRVRSIPRAAMAGVPSLTEFMALLPHVIQWAAAQFLRFTPSHPPPGSQTPRFRLGGPVEGASDDRRP
ncbi:TIR-like protein FxsC [Streptomyces sp. CA-251387]|uniref:TIR-like protein FxsC n=1 Tax=Streptomyces sp. CA-251387 TaxID=3240064 RepID=UPI003D8F7953